MPGSAQYARSALWWSITDKEHMPHTISASVPSSFQEGKKGVHSHPFNPTRGLSKRVPRREYYECWELIHLHRIYFPPIYTVYYFREIILHSTWDLMKPPQTASALSYSASNSIGSSTPDLHCAIRRHTVAALSTLASVVCHKCTDGNRKFCRLTATFF